MGIYQIHRGKLPYGLIFPAGVLAGILLIIVQKEQLLDSTGMLDEYTLYHMKYMTIDSGALFYYVLCLRMKTAVTLIILSTTYLGLVVCAGTAFWYGMSAGVFLGTVVIRYGLKGILFAMVGMLPQYILYVPALAALLVWCESLNRSIYFRSSMWREEEKGRLWPRRLLQLAFILLILLMGCLLESFTNPGMLEKFLKNF